MVEYLKWPCNTCGGVGFEDGGDGFFYCRHCHSQADDIIDTGVADEDFIPQGGGDTRGALYLASNRRQRAIKEEPFTQSQAVPYQSQLWETLNSNDKESNIKKSVKKEEFSDEYDDFGPTSPRDFGPNLGGPRAPTIEDYYNEVRMRYIMGIQLMIEFQCRALVEKLGASPLVCGFAGKLWLQFVTLSKVFDERWADEAITESESQDIPEKSKPRVKIKGEHYSIHGKRCVMIWYKAIRKRIPLSSSLAISFLACHIARDPILSTDIALWSLEGKLPYFSAFVDIEKQIGQPSRACPLSSSSMFRPTHSIPSQKLESLAASIAKSILLDLPPVNFFAIGSRFLKLLSLPVEEILPHACKLYEWSTPSELWLSSNKLRLPTCVYVMAILIVSIRILYDIHGFGKWESALDKRNKSALSDDHDEDMGGSRSSSFNLDSNHFLKKHTDTNTSVFNQKSKFDAGELLFKLEEKYYEIDNTPEYSKDLSKYLNYCKDVSFAGLEPPFGYHEEATVMKYFWDSYQDNKDVKPSQMQKEGFHSVFHQKRSRDSNGYTDISSKEGKKFKTETFSTENSQECSLDCDSYSSKTESKSQKLCQNSAPSIDKSESIKRLKADMEENRFCYIPPRVNIKRFDYLHYVRKRDEGALTYVAHADYYILLRAFAKAVRVDVRIMHVGVLSFERRLAWLEKRIHHCLRFTVPDVSCEFCSDVTHEHEDMDMDDCIRFSGLNVT